MMKKILYILLFTTLLACTDKDVIKGTAVSFYPNLVDAIVEGKDGISSASLELTGPGSGTVLIKVSNSEFVTTIPAMQDGMIEIIFDGNEESKKIDIAVARGNRTEDYTIDFYVSSVSGDIKGIASGTFSVFVTVIPTLHLPYFDDFESCSEEYETPEKWIEEFVGDSKTDRGWACRATNGVGGSNGVRASAFGGDPGTDNAWLITKGRLDLTSVAEAYMTFEMRQPFSGPGELFVWYSEDYIGAGDPTLGTWNEIPGVNGQLLSLSSGNYKTIAGDLNFLLGKKIFIAFQYVGGTDGGSIAFDMDNFSVSQDGSASEFFPIPFTDNLDGCSDFSIPSNFIQKRTPGSKPDAGWECSSNGTSGSQGVSAYGGSTAVTGTADAWLISAKAFDLKTLTDEVLSFDLQSRVAGSGTLNILWSTNYSGEGDPTSATWTPFSGFTLPAGGSNAYENIEVDISAATGVEAYIAFQFEGGTNSSSISYDMDNISIASSSGGGGGGGGGGTSTDPGNCDLTGGGTIIISHDFEGCTTNFEIPSGFIEAVVPGSKTDRGWGCNQDGTDGSRAVRGSAFGGEDGTDNAWLIMDAFDATPYTEISLTFDVQSIFSGPGDLFVLYSSDYSGSGDPTAANWAKLDNITSQLPAVGASEFATISTSPCSISGSTVYIAFQYVDGTSGSSSSWSIDNLELRGN